MRENSLGWGTCLSPRRYTPQNALMDGALGAALLREQGYMLGRSEREKAIEPDARWEKHEARRCPLCRRWRLGIQARR